MIHIYCICIICIIQVYIYSVYIYSYILCLNSRQEEQAFFVLQQPSLGKHLPPFAGEDLLYFGELKSLELHMTDGLKGAALKFKKMPNCHCAKAVLVLAKRIKCNSRLDLI